MSLESILQLLVFPCLGALWLKLGAIEARMAAGDVRFQAHEQRIARLELHDEQRQQSQ